MNRDLPLSANGRPSPKKVHSEPKPPKESDPLLAAYDELNASWNDAEAAFATMRVPVRVFSEVSKRGLGNPDEAPEGDESVCLEWTRHQNQWRICWVKRTQRYEEDWWQEESKPIAECPMEIRVEMAVQLRKLRQRMIEARNNYLPEVIRAIAAIKEALAD